MKLVFYEKAWEDYLSWQAQDRKLLAKLNGLIEECLRTPHAGRGKPEALRNELSGWWSRRIDERHRLVYKATEDALLVLQCRHHYDD